MGLFWDDDAVVDPVVEAEGWRWAKDVRPAVLLRDIDGDVCVPAFCQPHWTWLGLEHPSICARIHAAVAAANAAVRSGASSAASQVATWNASAAAAALQAEVNEAWEEYSRRPSWAR